MFEEIAPKDGLRYGKCFTMPAHGFANALLIFNHFDG
jgi:hypothetical protein